MAVFGNLLKGLLSISVPKELNFLMCQALQSHYIENMLASNV